MRLYLFAFILFFSVGVVWGYLQSDFPMRDLEPFVKRPEFCASMEYRGLPTATVIITVLNEETAMIETNIMAILAKTPPQLLDSIIVVDDFSEFVPVSPSILRFPKVELYRTESPKGVAGARMVGAEKGKGEVLIFLDAQMEVTERWIEPLMHFVTTHPKGVAAAIIDQINEQDGTYISYDVIPLVSLVLDRLDFKWTTPVYNPGYALYAPVLLGSAFAIRRSWFDEGGRYDPDNEVWGIENIELSVRVWTCGGEVVFLPCSHIGHVYRDTRKYPSPRFENTEFVQKNAIRFAEVWMDEHAEDYYANLSDFPHQWIQKIRSNPNLNERKLLRQQMKCKRFSWYYNTVVRGVMELYNISVPGFSFNATISD